MSLYDKYRPLFPGPVEGLGHAARTGRLAHAYLISGDQARTRSEFALLVAQFALCRQAAEQGRPCGECDNCRRLAQESYPELYTLRPAGKAYQIKVGDAGGRSEPNTARWFQEQLYLTSVNGERKIGIIYDIDRMNPASQNSFLKTLEEPPRDTLLLLLTGHPEYLLPTTRSRCQLLPVLENRTVFDFPGAAELPKLLYELFFSAPGRLDEGVRILDAILAIAGSIREETESRVEAEWESRIREAGESDAALAKRMTEESGDVAAGEYRSRRGEFLGLVHTFYAQLLLLASGAGMEDLANPELCAGLDFRRPIDSELALRACEACDQLLAVLRYNVLEELAWRTWMLRITVAA